MARRDTAKRLILTLAEAGLTVAATAKLLGVSAGYVCTMRTAAGVRHRDPSVPELEATLTPELCRAVRAYRNDRSPEPDPIFPRAA